MSATDDEINRKAYEIWDARGRRHGMDQDDWISAEKMLQAKAPPRLNGRVDVAIPARIAGWVRNIEDLNTPVTVAVLLDGRTVAQMVASLYRRDLEAAGIGDGRFSFEFTFERGFWPNGHHTIDVVCPAFGVPVPGERKTIVDLETAIAKTWTEHGPRVYAILISIAESLAQARRDPVEKRPRLTGWGHCPG